MRSILLALWLCTSVTWANRVNGWPAIAPTTPGDQSHPHDAALIVGVERYDRLPPVPYAQRDADAMTRWARLVRGIPGSRVQTLLDADGDEIAAALDRALQRVGPSGTLWVYYSGHGLPDAAEGTHLLLGADAHWGDGFSMQSPLSVEGIQRALDEDDAGHAVLIVDAGFSGAARGGELLSGRTSWVDDPPLPTRHEVVTWLAAGPGQWAGPLEEARQSLFTWHVVAALRGWADGALSEPDGALHLEEVQDWVRQRLRLTGRTQESTVDPRGPARAWALGPAQEPPPDLHQDPPAKPIRTPYVEPKQSLDPLARKDGEDDPAEIEATLRSKHLSRVNTAWARAYQRGRMGDLDALRLFIQQYGTVRFYHNARMYEVTAPQLPKARRMLANGGEPVEPLIPAVPLDPTELTLGSPVGTPHRGASEILTPVTLTRRIAVGRAEVTQAQYATVTGTNPHPDPHGDHPITGLNWYRVVAFCNGLSALDGFDPAYDIHGRRVRVDMDANGWRLPTEAEWMAAVGEIDPDASPCRQGNIRDRSLTDEADRCEDGFPGLSPVQSHPANALGLHGMFGNAAEWTADAWSPLAGRSQTDPAPGTGSLRVVKGPSYLTDPPEARTAARAAQPADTPRLDLGFRVVRTLPDAPESTGR